MRLTDLLSLSLRNALRHPLRSLLAALSVAAGIAALRHPVEALRTE